MNERLQELAEQATITKTELRNGWERKTYTYQEEVFDKEKFAELIVQECVKEMSQQMYWHRIDQSNNPNFYKAVEKTLKHFGVEERLNGLIRQVDGSTDSPSLFLMTSSSLKIGLYLRVILVKK